MISENINKRIFTLKADVSALSLHHSQGKAKLCYYGRAKASPQANLDFGGQWHFLKAYSARADLQQNVGTFLAFLCSSKWNEWYVSKRRSKGPGIEFKVHGMSLVNFLVN